MKQFLVLFSLFISVGSVLSGDGISDNNNKKVPVIKGTRSNTKEVSEKIKKKLKINSDFQKIAPINSLTPSRLKKLTKKQKNNK